MATATKKAPKKAVQLVTMNFKRGEEKKTCFQYVRCDETTKKVLVGREECLYIRKEQLTGVGPRDQIRVLIEVIPD